VGKARLTGVEQFSAGDVTVRGVMKRRNGPERSSGYTSPDVDASRMPILVCSDCGEEQRFDCVEFVACRYCASSNLRPVEESSTTLQPADG
jgi:ribosomal protein L40E